MSSGPLTLREFLTFTELSSDQLRAMESTGKFPNLRSAFSKRGGQVDWPVAFDEIVNRIADLLDVGIVEIAVGAWNKYRALRKYADRKRYPPNETFLVPLVTHTIKSTHHPYIELLMDGKPIGRIDFSIDLELTLEGAILKIRDGRIVEIRVGSAKGEGRLKCEEFVLFERGTGPLELPGSIVLPEGIPIAP